MTVSTTNTDAANNLFAQLGFSSGSSSGGSGSGSAAAIGQETFFKLMVTELTNQDPTKPVDSKNFLSEIAQFSSVAGIQDMQKSFSSLASSMSNNQALQAASLVGRDVLVPTGQAQLGASGGLNGMVELSAPAQQVSVGIYGAGGQLIKQFDLGPQSAGAVNFTWDGISMDGQQMPAGTYTVRASVQNDGQTQAGTVLTQARVSNVTLGRNGGPVTLGLVDGETVDLSQVRKIS
ncbi:MAG: flagellar hook assembly protein FlgD [Gammaproteobacteria bacterium]|jgi:flagellar basal-body rod modification protein FlgD